jgi:hypothetical protein
LLPPIWLVRVPRVRLIAETLFAQPLRRVFSPGHYSDIAIIDKVLLMTPENIHLNSFMYEPILDMSDEHLRKLYSDVKTL